MDYKLRDAFRYVAATGDFSFLSTHEAKNIYRLLDKYLETRSNTVYINFGWNEYGYYQISNRLLPKHVTKHSYIFKKARASYRTSWGYSHGLRVYELSEGRIKEISETGKGDAKEGAIYFSIDTDPKKLPSMAIPGKDEKHTRTLIKLCEESRDSLISSQHKSNKGSIE